MKKTIAQISQLIFDYEDGDFLLLSDLSDALANLKDYFLNAPQCLELIERMIFFVLGEMKGNGLKDFIENLGKGIDFLQQYVEARDDADKASILKKIARCFDDRKEEETGICKGIPTGLDGDTLSIFITEAKDRLAKAQELILFLEENMDDRETLNHLFRIFHTIKGECGFLKLATLGELTHNVENILDELRSEKIRTNQALIDLLLEGIDLSKVIIGLIEKKKFTMFNDFNLESYISRLHQNLAPTGASLGDILVQEGKIQEEDIPKILQRQKEAAFTKRFGEVAVEENFVSQEDLIEVVGRQKEIKTGTVSYKSEKLDPVIKVKAAKVNFLVDMIGELIIAMGQMNYEGTEFLQVRKITRTLQNAAMDLRTDSLHVLFGTIKRAVRDLAKELQKNVRLITKGEDLEIDRNLIEKLEAPLMHIIRNSLDHGIGTEEARIAKGKNPQAGIELGVERHGNSIVFTIRDDGRGIDREKVLSKALESGYIKAEAAAALNDQQILNLIFHSGFSTKNEVSQVSGRGVGMDVVQTVVSENRGKIEVDSVQGEYTEIKLVFPLSTAIIDGMITRVSQNNFIFPIGSVIESLKVDGSMLNSVNECVEIAIIRGESIPVIRMHEAFGIEEIDDPQIGVICETSDKRKFMFLLDEVLAKREVVIKSLGSRFANLKGISSGTVLGGGKIGLVIDIDELVQLASEDCEP